MFTDCDNDSISSKRVITFLAFLLCAIEFLAELFLQLDVKPATLDSMMYIVLAGLGLVASEKFAKKGDKK